MFCFYPSCCPPQHPRNCNFAGGGPVLRSAGESLYSEVRLAIAGVPTRQQNPSKQAPDGSKWKRGFSSKSAKTLIKTKPKSGFRRKRHNEIIRLRSFSTGQLAERSHMRSISSKRLFQVNFHVFSFFKNELKWVHMAPHGLKLRENEATSKKQYV